MYPPHQRRLLSLGLLYRSSQAWVPISAQILGGSFSKKSNIAINIWVLVWGQVLTVMACRMRGMEVVSERASTSRLANFFMVHLFYGRVSSVSLASSQHSSFNPFTRNKSVCCINTLKNICINPITGWAATAVLIYSSCCLHMFWATHGLGHGAHMNYECFVETSNCPDPYLFIFHDEFLDFYPYFPGFHILFHL